MKRQTVQWSEIYSNEITYQHSLITWTKINFHKKVVNEYQDYTFFIITGHDKNIENLYLSTLFLYYSFYLILPVLSLYCLATTKNNFLLPRKIKIRGREGFCFPISFLSILSYIQLFCNYFKRSLNVLFGIKQYKLEEKIINLLYY